MEYIIDENRFTKENVTGIFVRAKHENGKWESTDIVSLTKESLISWLKSRGGDNPYAEQVVCILLGFR